MKPLDELSQSSSANLDNAFCSQPHHSGRAAKFHHRLPRVDLLLRQRLQVP